jgi:hypothetical protein
MPGRKQMRIYMVMSPGEMCSKGSLTGLQYIPAVGRYLAHSGMRSGQQIVSLHHSHLLISTENHVVKSNGLDAISDLKSLKYL